jgi:5-(carboxyamino)imidazole ribonucleotide mutase
VPVAAVGVDMGENAAILAAQILAIDDKNLSRLLSEYREDMARKVEDASSEVGGI